MNLNIIATFAVLTTMQVRVLSKSPEIRVPTGGNVTLECSIKSGITEKWQWVYWRRKNETIYSLDMGTGTPDNVANDTRYESTISCAKCFLIKKLKVSDSGMYHCEVSTSRTIQSNIMGDDVYLQVYATDQEIPSTTSSVPYNTSEKTTAPLAKNEDRLKLLSLLILIPIVVIPIMVIIYRERSRIQECINGRCMAAGKRRGNKMNSSGSHDDPEGAQSVPLVKPDESLRKNDDSGSNAPQKRIHGRDGEQQPPQGNDSVESQIYRSESTPEFDASLFPNKEIRLSLGYGIDTLVDDTFVILEEKDACKTTN
ncbi:uncharacterized protein LOC135153837 [Lytechinus pictus]|uniref:uncharacterized protein LOC135153837 n=1 Tax=Lytechinus pictus TaxID=7653 RepID=UPI0030B9F49F